MAERVLTQSELNRALLARQLLLERVRAPLPRVLERMGGLQNQYAPSGYVGLWARVDGFRREDLTRALERRAVIQGTLMRETIHLVSRRDYPLLAAGIRTSIREWWRRVNKVPATFAMEPLAERLREFMRGTTRTRAELESFLRALDGPGTPLGTVHWVPLVRVPPAGTWEHRRANLYALAEEWVGPLEATEEDGLEQLVRRYLGAFGPATRADVSSWSGVPVARLAPALERVASRRFRDEGGRELLDVPRAPLPDPETPAPVRFLPHWDAVLLVHARRTQILPEEHRARIFTTKNPQSVATFLVDGRVAGTWRHEGGRIVVEPFERLPRAVRRELDDEAERLASLFA